MFPLGLAVVAKSAVGSAATNPQPPYTAGSGGDCVVFLLASRALIVVSWW